MDIRVDFNIEAAIGHNKDRDFTQEVDDFIFGGFVDWVRRDETGCYVYIQDVWCPVVDWNQKHIFPGQRTLTHLARYFYNLGQMSVKPVDGKYYSSPDCGTTAGCTAEWKPSKEQMEALMLAIEGKCPPTSYMSRRLEDLYEGLANTYNVECELMEDEK